MDASRRAVLAMTAGGLGALAGCSSTAPPSDDDGAASDQSLAGHPAAADLAAQPALGPDPTTATAVVVAFEDPSCTRCGRFEAQTFPRIRSELVDAGTLAFVYRGVPVVYDWGKPAVQALEATFARDGDAFWALKDHYYAEQEAFTTDNVLDRTETFLATATDLDAGAVVADARAKQYDDAVQADLAAGGDAGAQSVPTFFLFRDGQFRTRVSGPQSYDVFANALGV